MESFRRLFVFSSDESKMKRYLLSANHIASKNADYTEAERYLTFQHDERTGKPILDEDVKSHHYIISFDPKDRELGLTMEQAQKMGLEFTKQHGQKALDKENAEKLCLGEKPKQTKFVTEKEKIRKAILDTIEHSADEMEFRKKLHELYGIEVKESRGRWSYLPPGRERPVTGKNLVMFLKRLPFLMR